jgi:hypothetical protein
VIQAAPQAKLGRRTLMQRYFRTMLVTSTGRGGRVGDVTGFLGAGLAEVGADDTRGVGRKQGGGRLAIAPPRTDR